MTYSNDITARGGKFSLNATPDVDYVVLAQTPANATLLNQTQNLNGKAEGMLKLHSFRGPLLGNAGFQVGATNFVCDTCTFRRNFIGLIDEVKLMGETQ